MQSESRGNATNPRVFVDAEPFAWKWFAGIPRYAARLVLALAAEGADIHFFHNGMEIEPLRDISWSQDQDIEIWARHVWHGDRHPLSSPLRSDMALYCGFRSGVRIFPFEISVLHDLAPLVVGWTFADAARMCFEHYFSVDLLSSDFAFADSHSTKADAAWLSPMPQSLIEVAQPGMSLCVDSHRSTRRVRRSPLMALAVSTVEPRKNAGFLLDWFHSTDQLPRDMELWWVGKMGWLTTRRELKRMTNPAGGRRVRFLGHVSDAKLCRLYRRASWSIYPSIYEGFGFPVVDSLRHGTPVLTSHNSSLREFQHEGVYFFDPRDASTVDDAWKALRSHGPAVIPLEDLLSRYDWSSVARAILNVHARNSGTKFIETILAA